jgi:hypothetical protein
MKPGPKLTTAGIILVLAGSAWICVLWFRGFEILNLLSITCLAFGWYFIINSVSSYYSVKSQKKANRNLSGAARSGRTVRIIALVFLVINVSVCFTFSENIISYILNSRPSKTTTAKVVSVDNGPNFRHATYEVTLQYTNIADTIKQTFEIGENSYSAYWVGRPILIKYSLAYPVVYKVVRLL